MKKDTALLRLIEKEEERQLGVVNLIASENVMSDAVRAALGSVLGNKYAEGYSGKRYYGGNEIIDEVERLAIARALALFGLSEDVWHVNVQALSGSPANLAVLSALVPLKGKIMGMSLAQGGHLTHGHKVSVTGKYWTQVPYGVSEKTEMLDYGEIRRIAEAERPALIIAGFTAYARIIDWKEFRAIADSVGAILMVDMSHIAGLVAGGVHPAPFPYADVVTTTTHKTLRGPRGALIYTRKDERGFAEQIDRSIFPGLQGGPHMNQVAAIATALFEAATPAFQKYAAQVVRNTQTLASELERLGWRIVTGGTDNHLFLVDTFAHGVPGAKASKILERAGIIVNKNAIPFDTRPPADPSGIRIGCAAETTRGAKEGDMIAMAALIDHLLTEGE